MLTASCSGSRRGNDGGGLRCHAVRDDQVRRTLCFGNEAATHPRSGRTKLIDDQKREVPRYRGLVHGTVQIIKEEGFRGIYRGLGPVVSCAPRSDAGTFD